MRGAATDMKCSQVLAEALPLRATIALAAESCSIP
jgi:hypothetical protein